MTDTRELPGLPENVRIFRPEMPQERVSEDAVRNLMQRFTGLALKYYDGSNITSSEAYYSKNYGVIQGRYFALMDILTTLGQKDIVGRIDQQAHARQPIDMNISLEPIIQPTFTAEHALLTEYKYQYMQGLLLSLGEQNNTFMDWIKNLQKRVTKDNTDAKIDKARGVQQGHIVELREYLSTLGCAIRMDTIQQDADRMLRNNPQGIIDYVQAHEMRTPWND